MILRKLVRFKEGTAGSVLTTECAWLAPDISAREALGRLKSQAFNRETIYYVYVIDSERRLLGFISLKDTLVADSHKLIREIMHPCVIAANVDEDKEVVAKKLSDYNLLALPVVDDKNKLVGIVIIDDVVDVIMEEDTEDIYKYGAAGSYLDYMNSSALTIAKERIGWLLVLVVMGFVSGWVMQQYEFQLQAIVALAFFIPLLCDSGGNAGTQSSTVIIRGLATGEIRMRDVVSVAKKECLIGILAGFVMAVFAGVRALLMNKSPLLAITVGLAMIVTVVVSTTLGALLPLLFRRLRLDPALMSGPFITSIADIISLFFYLQISVFIFKM